MYATDRGIEELLERRGEETVSVEWLADRLRAFVDLNPAFENAVERVATFLARDDSLARDDLDDGLGACSAISGRSRTRAGGRRGAPPPRRARRR